MLGRVGLAPGSVRCRNKTFAHPLPVIEIKANEKANQRHGVTLCAGYRRPDGTVLGDPAEADFTTMLQEQLGWVPPPPEERTPWDVLPLCLQIDPDQPPQVFELPAQYVLRVPLNHPQHPQFAQLQLQWYAVPAVAGLEMSVGGITYTAAPFNGRCGIGLT